MSSVLFYAKGGAGSPLDSTKLLDELCGQPELITRLLHTFQADAQRDIDQLEAALAASDSNMIAAFAHRLKGSAATVGAESLRVRAAQIEDLGRQGALQQASSRMSELRGEFDRLCSYLQELRNSE